VTDRPGGERLYRGVLALYPTEFRRRFGDEMVQLYRDRLRDAHAGNSSWGVPVAWAGLLADVVLTAPGEHLGRNRTVAHSLTASPSLVSRVLGVAGIAAGVAILAVFVISLPQGWFIWRLIVFAIGIIAVAIGVHLRQSGRAPTASLVVTGALVAATAFFVVAVLFFQPGAIAGFWAGLALWLAGAAFGATSGLIAAVSRLGGWAVGAGSLLTLTGIDRLGFVSESTPTIFNTLSGAGVVMMAFGWVVLGVDVAVRRLDEEETI
jgi:hypothetical protein